MDLGQQVLACKMASMPRISLTEADFVAWVAYIVLQSSLRQAPEFARSWAEGFATGRRVTQVACPTCPALAFHKDTVQLKLHQEATARVSYHNALMTGGGLSVRKLLTAMHKAADSG